MNKFIQQFLMHSVFLHLMYMHLFTFTDVCAQENISYHSRKGLTGFSLEGQGSPGPKILERREEEEREGTYGHGPGIARAVGKEERLAPLSQLKRTIVFPCPKWLQRWTKAVFVQTGKLGNTLKHIPCFQIKALQWAFSPTGWCGGNL